jgi:O-acetyl-ADP-ribose deacetylase (regulator of RNase III)
MPFQIVRNDIVKMSVDVIVNAANASLKMGGGVCGAIFNAANPEKLKQACDAIGFCATGDAVITNGYDLPAKAIIHTVGPIWRDGKSDEANLLSKCYEHSLELALKNGFESIAFPLIAAGIFGYPKDEALRIAIDTIGNFLIRHDMMVYLVVYDKSAFKLSEKLFSAIENYIDDHYVETHLTMRDSQRELDDFDFKYNVYSHKSLISEVEDSYAEPSKPSTSNKPAKSKRNLIDVVNQLDEPFAVMLFRFIDTKALTDVTTYKRANIDRKLFSKIRSDKHYNPSKSTAIALAIALELNLDETRDLLSKAGYSLSQSNKSDVIIRFFIEEGIYNIFEINEALFAFDQPLLGA